MAEPQKIIFFDTDPDLIAARMVARMEQLLGKTIHPADIERLLIQSVAYEIMLNNIAGNNAANQMFAQFSSAPILDYLTFNVGIERLPPSKAIATILFTLVTGHTDVVIPIGTRVTSTDGQAVFSTTDNIAVPEGTDTASIEAESLADGDIGNGYVPGTIKLILDPQVYIVSATNTTTSVGGNEAESDDQLRKRIKLAKANTTAGSVDSYILLTLSSHPSIIDAKITNPIPGTVKIYPLVSGGIETPDPVLEAVLATCNAETARPLTDTVLVETPTAIEYTLSIGLVLYTNADEVATQAASFKAVDDYTILARGKLGLDVVKTKIIALAQVDGVYSVDPGAFADLIVSDTNFSVCTSIEVLVTSFTDG